MSISRKRKPIFFSFSSLHADCARHLIQSLRVNQSMVSILTQSFDIWFYSMNSPSLSQLGVGEGEARRQKGFRRKFTRCTTVHELGRPFWSVLGKDDDKSPTKCTHIFHKPHALLRCSLSYCTKTKHPPITDKSSFSDFDWAPSSIYNLVRSIYEFRGRRGFCLAYDSLGRLSL